MAESELLDTSGLRCPLPVLKAKKALKGMDAGETLKILATDPDSARDFEAFCETTGYVLENWSQDAGVFTYFIRKT